MADEEGEEEEVCTPVPAKPAIWTVIHYPATGKWGCPVPGLSARAPRQGRRLGLGPPLALCLSARA